MEVKWWITYLLTSVEWVWCCLWLRKLFKMSDYQTCCYCCWPGSFLGEIYSARGKDENHHQWGCYHYTYVRQKLILQQNCSDFHSVSFLSNTHPLETIQVILIPNLQIQTPRDLNISFDNEPTMIRLFISLNLRGGRREDHPGREIKAQAVVMMLCCGLTTVRDGWFIFGLLTGKRGCIETEFNVKKLFDKWSFSQSLSLCCATYLPHSGGGSSCGVR